MKSGMFRIYLFLKDETGDDYIGKIKFMCSPAAVSYTHLGTLWDEVINFGFTPTESIYPDEHQRVMQEIHSGNRLISSVFRQDPSHHSLTAPLYFEGKNFGAFGTTDINGPFTEAQKALLLEVVHFTELAMNHQIQAFLLQDEENYYVCLLYTSRCV